MVLDEYAFWLFDLDGTLVDVEAEYRRAVFDRVGERLGREFTDRESAIVWHGLRGDRNAALRRWGIDPETFWPTLHDAEDPQLRAEKTTLHDDARWLLERIDAPVGVVTHCQSFLADPVIDHVGLDRWVDAVVCCDDETGWKPDPDPVQLTIDSLERSAPGTRGPLCDGGSNRGVLVGDSDTDIGAAWNAGLDGVHVERHGHRRRGHCVLGDYRVRSLTDLASRDTADR